MQILESYNHKENAASEEVVPKFGSWNKTLYSCPMHIFPLFYKISSAVISNCIKYLGVPIKGVS